MTVTGEGLAQAPADPSIAARFAAARARAATALRDGTDGVTLAMRLAADVEAIVVELASSRFEGAGLGVASGVAILATGGFGRRELAPHSDLDLLFLCKDSPDATTEHLAQAILYPLWDAKVDAGHAVRSVRDALDLPASDLTAATALLDARFLVGDQALADNFLARYGGRVAGSSQGSLVVRLQEEQRSRHSRFGDTIFLLEPDLKNGPGGVRDMCAGRWAALARFGTGNPRALQELGEMSPRQTAAFEAAREWLLRVRVGLHLVAGRRQDQLRFDTQEKLAPMLYGSVSLPAGDIRPAVAPAVEMLMHQFQRHAKTISRETERLMQRAGSDPAHHPRLAPVVLPGGGGAADAAFVLRDGALEAAEPAVFDRKPSDLFRLFSVAIALDLRIGMRTMDLVADLAAHQAAKLRADGESANRFLEVLTDTRDQATPSRLEQMHDLGLLGALIPEWEPVAGRVQHDVYHVYTVDQHSLYAVAMMKALARGEHAKEHPRPTEEISQIERPAVLYLATLIHDIGKPLGRNHSIKGAAVAVSVARRLGMEEEDVRQVELLVREHLVMGLTSQRRDLEDPSLIARFARLCGDQEGLRELFLLTFCDLFSVGPGNLTSWKDGLLRELFQRTFTFMQRGPDLLKVERAALLRRRQRETAQKLGENMTAPGLGALFGSFPERYFTENTASRIAAHVRLIRERTGSCNLQFSHQPRRGFSDLVLVADDVPGFLAKVAGVLFANRIDILDATIFSRTLDADGYARKGEALDIFRVRKAGGGAVTDEIKMASIRQDLEAVLEGRTTVEALLAARPPASPSLFERSRPEVPSTEVKVDNDVSHGFTVLDIFTQDRPGVLYTIARVLHDQGLDIHWSQVATEADRVADIFYVRDKTTGEKVVDQKRLDDLCQALMAALPKPEKKSAQGGFIR